MGRITKVYSWMLPPLLEIGLGALLERHPGFRYAGAFATLDGLLAALAEQPEPAAESEVLFLNYDNAFEGYPQLFAELRAQRPELRILFLLPVDFDEVTVVRALRTGANGFLLHSVEPDEVYKALEELAGGRAFLQPQMTPLVLAELRKPKHVMREYDRQIQLTERERMLMQLAADGLSNVQIGDVLGLAEKTVRNQWSALFEKIGLNDRTQAVLWAIRTGQAELR